MIRMKKLTYPKTVHLSNYQGELEEEGEKRKTQQMKMQHRARVQIVKVTQAVIVAILVMITITPLRTNLRILLMINRTKISQLMNPSMRRMNQNLNVEISYLLNLVRDHFHQHQLLTHFLVVVRKRKQVLQQMLFIQSHAYRLLQFNISQEDNQGMFLGLCYLSSIKKVRIDAIYSKVFQSAPIYSQCVLYLIMFVAKNRELQAK
jgi:hypothetical protein